MVFAAFAMEYWNIQGQVDTLNSQTPRSICTQIMSKTGCSFCVRHIFSGMQLSVVFGQKKETLTDGNVIQIS